MNYIHATESELNTTINRINTICNTMYHSYLYKYANVVGLGLSMKQIKGTYLNYPSLTFLVTKKVPEGELNPKDKIPETLDYIPTDVIVSGELKQFLKPYPNKLSTVFYPKSIYNINTQNELLQGGDSIGYLDSKFSGTIACAVIDDSNIYLLSSGHILGDNGLTGVGAHTPVISPSAKKGGTNSNIIGHFNKSIFQYSALENNKSLNSNIVDAALAQIGDLSHKDTILTDVLKKGVKGYDEIIVSDALLADKVMKVGAGTKKTEGSVIMTNAVVKLNINNKPFIYTKQIITTPMADLGDSGSLGLKYTSQSSDSYSAFGLLMGGSETLTIYNPLYDVLAELGVDILNSKVKILQ